MGTGKSARAPRDARKKLPAEAMRRTPILALFFIWRLHGKPRHAYSLLKDVREVGIAVCKPSTVYLILSKMDEAGIVKSHLDSKGTHTRRLYQTTEKGWKILHKVKDSRMKGVWREFVQFLLS
ncbi:MAG: PadR family transcriptional regulator [Candidatus Micrarchaeota archaeon]|nr:PadR family transcriptional regulator [Candidatus Micrarchaeota archaeon]